MSRLFLVDCEKMACGECDRGDLNGCIALDDEVRAQYSGILILESSRCFLHLHNFHTNTEPRYSESKGTWETVYYGKQNDTLRTIKNVLGAYLVGSYLSLYYIDKNGAVRHSAVPRLRTELEYELLHGLLEKPERFLELQHSTRRELSDRLVNISMNVRSHLNELIPELANETVETISSIVGNNCTVLGQLMPILIDDEVEEVYLDFPGDRIYFDHSRFGRTLSEIVFDDKSTKRLMTLLRAESNLHLDRRNPSLKTRLILPDVTLRVSASCPPLSPDGMHLEIRRAKQEPFSIIDLVRNKTLSVKLAAMLVLAINMRMNITITGAPSSGKTTLLNALDAVTPENWRKIYIEDAIESRRIEGRHQVRIQVDPIDEIGSRFEKSAEITKSLHRSPDYLVLGEIQTAEHSRALFQAVSAGLKSMQTCHSDSAAGLISRWMLSHDVPRASIALMDILVTLRRPSAGQSLREVCEVAEVVRSTKDGLVDFEGLNVIFDNRHQNEQGSWLDNGAFLLRARENKIPNLALVYGLIVRIMEESVESDSINPFLQMPDLLSVHMQ